MPLRAFIKQGGRAARDCFAIRRCYIRSYVNNSRCRGRRCPRSTNATWLACTGLESAAAASSWGTEPASRGGMGVPFRRETAPIARDGLSGFQLSVPPSPRLPPLLKLRRTRRRASSTSSQFSSSSAEGCSRTPPQGARADQQQGRRLRKRTHALKCSKSCATVACVGKPGPLF